MDMKFIIIILCIICIITADEPYRIKYYVTAYAVPTAGPGRARSLIGHRRGVSVAAAVPADGAWCIGIASSSIDE